MVMLRKRNGHQLSHYFNCGSTITGPRADEERIRGVLLAQLTRMTGDTIGIAVHFSGGATPINSGSSGTPAQCTSTGRGESELLDKVIQRVGGVENGCEDTRSQKQLGTRGTRAGPGSLNYYTPCR